MSPKANKDWFRSSTWTNADRTEFEATLARARVSRRAQYLRIQAWSLARTSDPALLVAALQLLDRVLTDYPDDVVQRGPALALRADCLLRLDDVVAAVAAFRTAIHAEATTNTARTMAWLEFGWRVVKEDRQEFFAEVSGLFEEQARDPRFSLTFPVQRYHFHAVRALIAQSKGLTKDASENARHALDAAALQHSGLQYHASLGLVDEVVPKVHDELVRLGAGHLER